MALVPVKSIFDSHEAVKDRITVGNHDGASKDGDGAECRAHIGPN